MAVARASQDIPPVATSGDLISLSGFHAILWVGIAICTLMCAGRIYIRFMCFSRLLLDDWLMIFSWVLLICIAALGQVYLTGIYMLMGVSRGSATPGPNFLSESQEALRGFGIALLFSFVGIWTIKVNYLLFFKRLGSQHAAYTKAWWIVLVITLACGAVNFGLLEYNCLFRSIFYVIEHCASRSVVQGTYNTLKVSVAMDVLSDALIICFPIVVLWRVRISLRGKIALSAIFSLVSLTIAVTIVRGSIFGNTYKSISENTTEELNVTWIWFWFFIEYTVSLIVACLVSFRALFIHKQHRTEERQRVVPRNAEMPTSNGLRRKAKQLHDSLLMSFKTYETTDDTGLPISESGNYSSSFVTDTATVHPSKESPESVVSSSA